MFAIRKSASMICSCGHTSLDFYFRSHMLHKCFWSALGSWREFGCRDDAKAWRKSTKEADKHKIFLLQFRK